MRFRESRRGERTSVPHRCGGLWILSMILLRCSASAWTTIRSNDRRTMKAMRPGGLSHSNMIRPETSLLMSTPGVAPTKPKTLEQHKAALLQFGAILDRGQAYNPTSGDYYQERMDAAVAAIDALLEQARVPTTLAPLAGEWELVLSTVPHGIFRSSPFFLAIQEAYCQEPEGMAKADLFFKLHELQTCSWGISNVGRVAQHIVVDDSPSSDASTGYLYSEFDTSIFSLTVIPILGWFKLLPTFGGCVVTAAACALSPDGILRMTVEYTTARPVPGLSGLFGDWVWNVKVPVGAIWKRLPWNQGRDATCQVSVRYVDEDFRIVQDISGDYFVYTRPVVPRALDLAMEPVKNE